MENVEDRMLTGRESVKQYTFTCRPCDFPIQLLGELIGEFGNVEAVSLYQQLSLKWCGSQRINPPRGRGGLFSDILKHSSVQKVGPIIAKPVHKQDFTASSKGGLPQCSHALLI